MISFSRFTPASSVVQLKDVFFVILLLLVLEQVIYRYKKRQLPGDTWTIPVIGKFADSLHLTLENYKRQWDSGPLSVVSVFNIFIVMSSSSEYSHKIMNSPNYAEPALVHSAKKVMVDDNWIFLMSKVHHEYRRGLNTLFTRRALGIYLKQMDATTRKHLAQWLVDASQDPTPKSIMTTVCALNMNNSLRVFCGPHISEAAAQEILEKYWMITVALELVNFPFAIPGTKVYRAIQARKVAMRHLEHAAASSKQEMATGAEPVCMLDHWVVALRDPAHKGRRDFSDREMAMVLFSFLFASQDAMSSGLIYGFQHLADHPDFLLKVRAEQEKVRGGDCDKPVTLEMMDDMPYLRAFVKESLRVMPPVTMVPFRATKAFPITDDYTVPARSLVIPSYYNSLHDPEVYPDPDALIPDRWLDPNSSANTNPRYYLGFGSGAHRCIGMEYAMMNIALVLADAAVLMDWEHHRSAESDKVQIIATLFPKDGYKLKFSPRERGGELPNEIRV
ncbi:cytochrome P450 sterol C22-desaturase [Obba rivulosa]|uniref:sterol 22-desaturase n=1 Tax=Obba rivulosa TaxID=1052685 RepID=A0A8E2J2A5_9APHY|nr:cytochrome P450 sterol C22-desaturase [Obba rivulosa]